MQRADKRKYHYIYRIMRNDGKFYIGMHSTDDLDDGYFGSGQRISRSIKKHGRACHRKEIIEFLPSRILLKTREKELITEELRADPRCMNIAPGGGGGFISDEHRKKFLDGQKRISKQNGRNTGPTNIVATRTPEARTKANSTNARSGGFQRCLEAAASKEAIAKRKATMAKRGHSRGEKNSQFGTCWVVADSSPIKIQKEQLSKYLNMGYSRGRKQQHCKC